METLAQVGTQKGRLKPSEAKPRQKTDCFCSGPQVKICQPVVVVVVAVAVVSTLLLFYAQATLPADSESVHTAASHYFPSCVKSLTHQIIITAIICEMRPKLKNRFRN